MLDCCQPKRNLFIITVGQVLNIHAGDLIDYDGRGKIIFDIGNLKTPLAFSLRLYRTRNATSYEEFQ